MAWFLRPQPPVVQPVAEPPDDSPEALRAAIWSVVRLVNASAGRLPGSAVVQARRITDLLATVVDTSGVRPLDVYAAISVRAAATDYLPTTIRSFLVVDDSLVGVTQASGLTPVQSLRAQLADLETSATEVLEATRRQDVDSLMTQGSFLRTKFAGSDLDL